jgi:hypothetical protein
MIMRILKVTEQEMEEALMWQELRAEIGLGYTTVPPANQDHAPGVAVFFTPSVGKVTKISNVVYVSAGAQLSITIQITNSGGVKHASFWISDLRINNPTQYIVGEVTVLSKPDPLRPYLVPISLLIDGTDGAGGPATQPITINMPETSWYTLVVNTLNYNNQGRMFQWQLRGLGQLTLVVSVNPPTITSGGTANISFQSRNSDVVELAAKSTGGGVVSNINTQMGLPTSGSVPVQPQKTTTYAVVAMNDVAGILEQDVTVTVVGAQQPSGWLGVVKYWNQTSSTVSGTLHIEAVCVAPLPNAPGSSSMTENIPVTFLPNNAAPSECSFQTQYSYKQGTWKITKAQLLGSTGQPLTGTLQGLTFDLPGAFGTFVLDFTSSQ